MPAALSLAPLLLMGALAAAWWFMRPRRGARRDAWHDQRHVAWIRRAGAAFALPTLLTLMLLGRIDALWRLPAEFDGVRQWLPAMAATEVVTAAPAMPPPPARSAFRQARR